jgi:hypothetical protein
MTEIKSLFGVPEPYATFNREERNCLAMLYLPSVDRTG